MKRMFSLLGKIKSRYVMVAKMVPLSNKLRLRLARPFQYNSILSMGRVTHLAWRIRLTARFVDFVLEYGKRHGSLGTVKFLKACHVSLQKELGQDRLVSLATLASPLEYSRTAGGLVRIIPVSDRKLIRQGKVSVIRFWSGLFNLYRVIQCPAEPKLNTITDPFTGNQAGLSEMISDLELGTSKKDVAFFSFLEGFERIPLMSLVPDTFVLSRSASPSNKMSCTGILTDIHLLNRDAPELWQEILYYLHAVGAKASSPFVRMLENGYQITVRMSKLEDTVIKTVSGKFMNCFGFVEKPAAENGYGPGKGLSQFAVKLEPAGKIRLFALIDSVSQSVMAPLHRAMFSLLRLIPNDGTFDQLESIRRSQFKANQSGCAFSFDLTAATDRLPASLTAALIGNIFSNKDIAECWLGIMTKRDFGFLGNVAQKLKVSNGPYRYSVGQPMGGLSSWAGLAITHHLLVQLAAFRATGNRSWNTQYEILGDDLVIFDPLIAKEYLAIMEIIGCEINLNKSISSPRRPVFEFAKRTCWGTNIVSGVSIAQIQAGWNISGRVANVLNFADAGLITKPSLLAITLSRYAFSNGKANSQVSSKPRDIKLFALGILSLLGTLQHKGVMSLQALMTAVVNPHYEDADYSDQAVGLPLKASLEAGFSMLKDAENGSSVSWSHQETRDEVYKEYFTELIDVILQTTVNKARDIYSNQEKSVQEFSRRAFKPFYYCLADGEAFLEKNSKGLSSMKAVPMEDLTPEIRLLYIQIESYLNQALSLEGVNDPEKVYDDAYALLYKHAKWRNVSFSDATLALESVERLEYSLKFDVPAKPGRTILESAPILSYFRSMRVGKPATYTKAPSFRALY